MNVMLVNPNCGFQTYMKSAPLGLLSIATYLKQRGCDVRLYDRKIEMLSPEKATACFWPDAVGVCVGATADVRDGIKISKWFHERGVTVIWGGQFASIIPELVLREGYADYVAIGEGEVTFHELLQAVGGKGEVAGVNGLAYLESGEMHLTAARQATNLADFPVIDNSFVDVPKYFFTHVEISRERVLCIYASKGCPGSCTFCYNTGFHRSTCRNRPVDFVLREIEELATNYGMNGIFFVDDDMFGANKNDMLEFCRRLRDLNRDLSLDITWRCFARAAQYSREELQLLYDAGCRRIFCGVESGSQQELERMNKGVNLEDIENAMRMCHEVGIATASSFVLGFTDETEAQLMETVRVLKRFESPMNWYQISKYFPLPGSAMWNQLVAAGRLVPPKTLYEWGKFKLQEDIFGNFCHVPTRDLHVVQAHFYWKSFFRKTSEKGRVKREVAISAIRSGLRNILRQNLINMTRYAFSSGLFFLKITWYAHAYPGVRKKYELY